MNSYIKEIEKRLTDDQKDILKRIYEPTVVATPLYNSRRDICILPDGEIRSYGKLYIEREFAKGGQTAYLASKDGGLTWNISYSHSKMNCCAYIEKGDLYITVCDIEGNYDDMESGLYVYRSKIGPDDTDPEIIKLSDERFICSFLPKQSEYTNRIWFTTQLKGNPYFFYSDDLGLSWTERKIPNPHCYEIVFPNKGNRWSKGSGTEPIVVEISENEMMMIIRTPMDCFYKSYSTDGGDSWSVPEPTDFYGTNTTAFLLKLSDGRIINFWNNTKPLSQPNHAKIPSDETVITGIMENGFTNRDAAHAAISEDGAKTFIGYREFLLNPVRNNADFRYIGGPRHSGDRSVHQFQAYELPFNKVLVSAGQSTTSRRLVIFDIDWLYETTRKENFISGIENITAHTYLKSVPLCQLGDIGNGHCAFNRTYSAYPMPDPENDSAEALLISKHHDERLVNDIGGMCWNFPLAKQGRVTVNLKIVEKQARFILSDRWYNTCDPYVANLSPFWFDLDELDLGNGYCKVDIDFDTEKGVALVYTNEEFLFKVNMTTSCTTGISYLIMQCATDGDSKGFYIKSMEKS